MITATDAIESLRRVVAGREDYVYRKFNGKCVYFATDGAPSCVVGHVLVDLNIDVNVIHGPQNTEPIWNVAGIYDLATPGAIAVLDMAQVAQDLGRMWGSALAAAESCYAVYT